MGACAVEDLLAAGSTWRDNHRGNGSRIRACTETKGAADGGEKDHFADLERTAVMLLFVAERAGHAAAATGDDMDRGAG